MKSVQKYEACIQNRLEFGLMLSVLTTLKFLPVLEPCSLPTGLCKDAGWFCPWSENVVSSWRDFLDISLPKHHSNIPKWRGGHRSKKNWCLMSLLGSSPTVVDHACVGRTWHSVLSASMHCACLSICVSFLTQGQGYT